MTHPIINMCPYAPTYAEMTALQAKIAIHTYNMAKAPELYYHKGRGFIKYSTHELGQVYDNIVTMATSTAVLELCEDVEVAFVIPLSEYHKCLAGEIEQDYEKVFETYAEWSQITRELGVF